LTAYEDVMFDIQDIVILAHFSPSLATSYCVNLSCRSETKNTTNSQ